MADTLAWRTQADHVLGYLTERLVFDRACHVMGTDLLLDFARWAEDRGLRAWGYENAPRGSAGTARSPPQASRSAGCSTPPGCPGRPTTSSSSPLRPVPWHGVGVRFRTEADDAQDALQAPWQGWQGSSDYPSSLKPRDEERDTPATPATAVGGDSDGPF